MSAGAKLRRLVGADRPESEPGAFDAGELDRAVSSARAKVERAQAELDEVSGLQRAANDAVTAAVATFDSEPTDALADRVVDARRAAEKQQLFVRRAQQAAAACAAELHRAERARAAAEFDYLFGKYKDTSRLRELVAPKLDELIRLATEINAMVTAEVDASARGLRRAAELYQLANGQPWAAADVFVRGATGSHGVARYMLHELVMRTPGAGWLKDL